MNRIFTFKQGRSRAIVAGVCSIVFAASLSAQVTSVKLPTADSSASFKVLDNGSVVKMRVNGDGGFYAGGTYGTGVIPVEGAGTRMMWHPAKAAFRAGLASGTEWDNANIGIFSTATGFRATASGQYSLAMGYYTTASGMNSIAMGMSTRANGNLSTAIGANDTASGPSSTAMGYQTTASGNTSIAMGMGTLASGLVSIAMGNYDTASGNYTTAMGCKTIASGLNSTAMGSFVSTATFNGAFIIGDNSTSTTTNATAANQMTMRFAGGYNLFTNSTASVGVSLAASGNSWASISDSTKKTNFVKADHDYFLSSLSKLKLGSWNYKAQDAKQYRHYGPMAQEIFHYFGRDGKGTIGCDTLLASADMDGIMMICLQALEKRTGELQQANKKIAEHETRMHILEEKIERLSRLVSSSTKNKEQLAVNTSKEGQR